MRDVWLHTPRGLGLRVCEASYGIQARFFVSSGSNGPSLFLRQMLSCGFEAVFWLSFDVDVAGGQFRVSFRLAA